MLRGEELMGFANVADLKSLGDYDEAKDAEHLEGDGIFMTVPEGWFVIFGTEDAHMPCLEPGRANTVKKVVLKIRAR
jgi:YhcH/YjgK/YiaL family protein